MSFCSPLSLKWWERIIDSTADTRRKRSVPGCSAAGNSEEKMKLWPERAEWKQRQGSQASCIVSAASG